MSPLTILLIVSNLAFSPLLMPPMVQNQIPVIAEAVKQGRITPIDIEENFRGYVRSKKASESCV